MLDLSLLRKLRAMSDIADATHVLSRIFNDGWGVTIHPGTLTATSFPTWHSWTIPQMKKYDAFIKRVLLSSPIALYFASFIRIHPVGYKYI